MAGTLYIVATPIGNLEDMTHRAIRVLGEVRVVACEDTRQTRKLLDHYGITTPAVSYHDHNEAARSQELCRRLTCGEDVALVSDAGTPLISDPGYRMVNEAVRAGIRVVPIPGACAATTALSASGLPSDAFCFRGFPPRKPGERARFFESLRTADGTVILYEAPHRILETLDDLARFLDDPPVVAARELTKLHEEMLRGAASEVRQILAARETIKGEFTVLVGKSERPKVNLEESLSAAVARLEAEGLSHMEAIKAVARDRGLPKRTVYAELEKKPRG
jgi:16S rRNA (cytidine1402-2'-O)-methyltransferase